MRGGDQREDALTEAVTFIWREADLLDRAAYEEWLGLWAPDGRYVVPIDPTTTDFEATLNYAYDDAAMREMRVRRLVGGQSTSAVHAARTVRTVSRFVTVRDEADMREMRCSQLLVAYKREETKLLAADLTYHLVRHGANRFAIQQKVVRLVNAADSLSCFGYLL